MGRNIIKLLMGELRTPAASFGTYYVVLYLIADLTIREIITSDEAADYIGRIQYRNRDTVDDFTTILVGIGSEMLKELQYEC